MKTIGITGGVGAGKSQLLDYIENHYNCIVLRADLLAHQIKEPGQICYRPLIQMLGEEILDPDGQINKIKMAEKIFHDSSLLKQVNELMHPAVKHVILDTIALEERKGELDFLFVEAALLIEEGYDQILDELWYIYADEIIRRDRLKKTRNYSDEKITQIFAKQKQDTVFRQYCKVIIDNSDTLENAYKQIDQKLEEYLWQM